jgi:hypothetical protein
MLARRQLPFIWLISFLSAYYIFIISQPLLYHLRGATVSDDAFYYLTYARNIAAGKGPTYGGIITNGVQPLWALLQITPALVVHDQEALLRTVLCIGALFNILSLVIMWNVLHRLTSPSAAWFAVLAYVGYLTLTRVTLSGMEISLCLFSFSLLLLALVTDRLRLLSIALVLLCLSRVDLLIYLPFIAIIIKIKHCRLRRVLEVLAPVIVIMACYFVLNRVVFGVWLPISGEVKAVYWAQKIAPSFGTRFNIAYWAHTAAQSTQQLGWLIAWLFEPVLRGSLVIGALTILATVVGLTLRSIQAVRLRRVDPLWLLGVAAYVHVYAFYWQLGTYYVLYQSWYYAAEILLLVVCVGIAFKQRVFNSVGSILVLACTVLYVWQVFNSTIQTTRATEDVKGLEGLYHAALAIPPDVRAGSFNSGVIGYFSRATVINLDGLMNNVERLDAIRSGRPLVDYLKAHDIQYVADYQDFDIPGYVVSSGPMIDEFGILTCWRVVRFIE